MTRDQLIAQARRSGLDEAEAGVRADAYLAQLSAKPSGSAAARRDPKPATPKPSAPVKNAMPASPATSGPRPMRGMGDVRVAESRRPSDANDAARRLRSDEAYWRPDVADRETEVSRMATDPTMRDALARSIYLETGREVPDDLPQAEVFRMFTDVMRRRGEPKRSPGAPSGMGEMKRRDEARMSARDFLDGPTPAPPPTKAAASRSDHPALDYDAAGPAKAAAPTVAEMRAALKARFPRAASSIDTTSDEDIRTEFARTNGG